MADYEPIGGDPGWMDMPDGYGWQEPGRDDAESPEDGAASSAPQMLPLANLKTWDADAPERVFAWGSWIPLRQTTMLTGAGGVGKSLLAQMLLTCIALGRPFLGMESRRMVVLYLTAEDDTDELWRRQRAICAMLGVLPSELDGRLHVVSLVGEDGVALMEPGEKGGLERTRRWGDLRHTVLELGVQIVAIDTATDMFAGDHNAIHEVAEFINMLTGLALEMDGAVIVLHHPNKGGDDWLGSIAWHNKVRSRLIVKRPTEDDPDARTIENPKANYGPSGGKIEFRWDAGALVLASELSTDRQAELDQLAAANGANSAFLRCLRARVEQGDGRQVGPSPGPNYAPSQFEGMAEAKGYGRVPLKHAMDRLYKIGSIRSETHRNPVKGRDVTIIVEVGRSEGIRS